MAAVTSAANAITARFGLRLSWSIRTVVWPLHRRKHFFEKVNFFCGRHPVNTVWTEIEDPTLELF